MTIEQRIAQLMAESEQFDEAANVVTKNASASQPTDLDKATSEQNPDNAKGDVDNEKEAEGGTSKKTNANNKDATAPKACDLKASCKEDVAALIDGEDLSEEFKTKAATIFEASVFSRVKIETQKITEQFEEAFDEQLEEAVTKEVEGLIEQIDGYLSYMAEEWMNENELALESGIKAELAENFMSKIKSVFEESYIDIPENRVDVVAEMEELATMLEAKLQESETKNIQLHKSLANVQRSLAIKESVEDLTDVEADKFKSLAEEISYDSNETFSKKLKAIRESYFVKKQPEVKTEFIAEGTQSIEEPKAMTAAVTAYTNFLSR